MCNSYWSTNYSGDERIIVGDLYVWVWVWKEILNLSWWCGIQTHFEGLLYTTIEYSPLDCRWIDFCWIDTSQHGTETEGKYVLLKRAQVQLPAGGSKTWGCFKKRVWTLEYESFWIFNIIKKSCFSLYVWYICVGFQICSLKLYTKHFTHTLGGEHFRALTFTSP